MNVDHGMLLESSVELLVNTLLEASKEHPLDILDTEPHPSDLTLALLSAIVYTEKALDETDGSYGEKLGLPEGWRLLCTGFNKGWANGYFGAAFVHSGLQQVVVVHRGTTLTNTGALFTDVFGIYGNQYTDCMNTAITFADHIKQVIYVVNSKAHGRCYNLTITGHSLGGWLAQITAFTIKYVNVCNGALMKNTKDGIHAKTVVFDSPGAKGMLDKIRDHYYERYEIDVLGRLDRLDITVYVSAPNRINTCGAHIGTVYRVFIDFSEYDYEEMNSPLYNQNTHAIDNFVNAFEKSPTNFTKVLDWAVDSNEFSSIFGDQLLNQYNNFHVDVDKNKRQQNYLDKIKKRYQLVFCESQPYDEISIVSALSVFSECEVAILDSLIIIKKQTDVKILNDFLLEKKLEIKNDKLFPDFEINRKNQTIICKPRDLSEIINRVKQLMRWLGPEFLEAVEKQSRTTDLIYRAEGQDFLDSLQKTRLNFIDSIGLRDFLASDTERVLWIETRDGAFEVNRLYNVFSQIKESLYVTNPIQRYTNESYYTFLSLPRLQKLYNIYGPPVEQCNLIILDGSSIFPMSLEDWTFLNNYVHCSASNFKKLIFISSQQIGIFKSLKNLKAYRSERKINILDLSDDSQKIVLHRKLFAIGDNVYSFKDFLQENSLISEINQFLSSDYLKLIATDDSYVFVIKDTRPRLSDQQMPIYETNIKTSKECILNCVNSPNTLFVMSRKELETLSGWEQLGKKVILAEGDAGFLFRETCNENEGQSIYRLEVSKGDIYCKQIFKKGFYVCRNFFHRVLIDMRNLAQTKHLNDLFVIYNEEDKTALLGLVRNCKEREALIENVQIAVTKYEEVFVIEKHFHKNIHFVKILQREKRCEIEWRYSHGSVDSLRPYVSTESNDPMDELTLSKTERKLVIVTDEPGMGKSTTLSNLSRLIETPWVIYIQLQHFHEHIKDKLSDELTHQNVASFILSESCTKSADRSLEHNFLIYLLQSKTCSRRVVLMFDGYDEVDDYNKKIGRSKEKLLKLFGFLVNIPAVQLFLATRTYLKDSLEGKLSHFSTSFVPINKEQQQNFLFAFWHVCLSLELEDYGTEEENRLMEYAGEVLRQSKRVLGPDLDRFMGVPLQLRMLAEVFRPQSNLLVKSREDLFKSINMLAAPNLYQRFINLKYNIYLHNKTFIGEALNDEYTINKFLEPFTITHGALGFKTFFSDFFVKNFKPITDQELVRINRIGLMQSIGNGAFQFIHRTYAEYYCAQIVVRWLNEQQSIAYQLFKDILLPQILLNPESKVIRLFLNVELEKSATSDHTLKINAEHISRLWFENNSIFRNKEHHTALHIAIQERNAHIVTLLLSGLNIDSTQKAFVSFITQYDMDCDTSLHLMDKPMFHNRAEDDSFCDRIMDNIFKCIETCSAESKKKLFFTFLFNRDISKSYVSNYLLNRGNMSSETSKILKKVVTRVEVVQLESSLFREALLKNVEFATKMLSERSKNNNNELSCLLLMQHKDYGMKTVLHLAAQGGHLDIVKLIANLTSVPFTVLMARRGYDNMTPLLTAAECGHLEIVKYLVESGADINTCGKQDKSALMFAAGGGHVLIVKYLVKSGAEINSTNDSGETALYIAAKQSNLSVVEDLVKSGTDINSTNNRGWTALHAAAWEGHLPVVKYLLQLGSNPDRVDRKGWTALTDASFWKNWDVVRVLLEVGADVNADGGKALSYAIEAGEWSIVKCFVDKGSSIRENIITQKLTDFKEKFPNYKFNQK